MLTKIKALLMAIYLFFMCIPYGNSPIDIKMTEPTLTVWNGDSYTVYELKDGMEPIELVPTFVIEPSFIVGSNIEFSAKCKNVGRPFKGHEPFHPNIELFKVENGKRTYISLTGIIDEESKDVLIKNGDILNVYGQFELDYYPDEAVEPGVYSLEISVYGCKTVFEDVIVIK